MNFCLLQNAYTTDANTTEIYVYIEVHAHPHVQVLWQELTWPSAIANSLGAC